MAILPGLDELATQYGYNQVQKRVIAANLYFVFLCGLLVLLWLMRNIWTILVKQGKWKVLPLLIFYIIATTLIVVRLIFTIWHFELINNWNTIFMILPQNLKFLIGINMTWVTLELCFCIRHCLNTIKSVGDEDKPIFPHNRIKWGRIVVATFVIGYSCVLLIALIII